MTAVVAMLVASGSLEHSICRGIWEWIFGHPLPLVRPSRKTHWQHTHTQDTLLVELYWSVPSQSNKTIGANRAITNMAQISVGCYKGLGLDFKRSNRCIVDLNFKFLCWKYILHQPKRLTPTRGASGGIANCHHLRFDWQLGLPLVTPLSVKLIFVFVGVWRSPKTG